MAARACEYYPMLPSPFSAGAMGAAIFTGLIVSGSGALTMPAVHQVQVSGASQLVYYAENRVAVVPQQDYDDVAVFANFSLGMSKSSNDVPGYFFDILQEDFESLLA